MLLFATEFGVVVTQRKLTEIYSFTHTQRFQAESGPGFSYGGISAVGSFCGSPYPIFSRLVMPHLEKTVGATKTHILAILAPGTESGTKLVLRQCLMYERMGRLFILVRGALSKSQQAATWASDAQSHWLCSPQCGKWTWW